MPEENYIIWAQKPDPECARPDTTSKIRKSEKTYFDLPGGRINKDESITEALAREIHEETGINSVSSLQLLGMAPTSIQFLSWRV